jgi:hypothetical protein
MIKKINKISKIILKLLQFQIVIKISTSKINKIKLMLNIVNLIQIIINLFKIIKTINNLNPKLNHNKNKKSVNLGLHPIGMTTNS